MGGPRLTDDIKLTIANLHLKGQSARQIQKAIQELFNVQVHHSTIELYMKRVPPDSFLEPWGAGWPTDAQEIAYLLRLLSFPLRQPWPELTVRAAGWALKLRVAAGSADTDADVQRHLTVAHSYAEREQVAAVLDRPIYTADLDAWLMYRPWESDRNRQEYEKAKAERLVREVDPRGIVLAKELLHPGFLAHMKEFLEYLRLVPVAPRS